MQYECILFIGTKYIATLNITNYASIRLENKAKYIFIAIKRIFCKIWRTVQLPKSALPRLF